MFTSGSYALYGTPAQDATACLSSAFLTPPCYCAHKTRHDRVQRCVAVRTELNMSGTSTMREPPNSIDVLCPEVHWNVVLPRAKRARQATLASTRLPRIVNAAAADTGGGDCNAWQDIQRCFCHLPPQAPEGVSITSVLLYHRNAKCQTRLSQ